MLFLDWLFGNQKESVLASKPVILYGTGNLGRDFLMTLNKNHINPICFCNSDASKSGTTYCGLPVISVEELEAIDGEYLIVIATQTYAADIKKSLISHGIKRECIFGVGLDLLTALFSRLPTNAAWIPLGITLNRNGLS